MESKIEVICKNKEKELLEKYFGNLVEEAAKELPESVGRYTKELPHEIEQEFREFLEDLWRQISDSPLVLEEQKLRRLMTEDDREAIDAAYKKSKHITLWERISKTNHKDVTFYKGLLYQYTKELLMIMRLDFLEEITGNNINCKSFE